MLVPCMLRGALGALSTLALLSAAVIPPALSAAVPRAQGGGASALVHLPADDAMHPQTANEWWYLVGHLHDAAGHHYGYEAVVFRFSHLRKALPGLPFDTVDRADTALTDEGAHTFSGGVRYVMPGLGLTSMSTAMLKLRAGPITMARLTSGAGPAYRVTETTPDGSKLNLTARATKPPLLVGDSGLIPMGKHGTSYYYSLTELQTTGTLVLHGRGRPLAVTGLSWMDHQWGNWDWSGISGWDWMALQLDNHQELNITDFIGGRGSPQKAATVSLPTGHQTVTLHVRMTPLGRWRSPLTKILYPSGWRIRAPDLGLDVTVRPTVAGQEMTDRFAPDQSYWEGSCTVSGTLHGKPISGLAYTELAGYGAGPVPAPGTTITP